MQKKLFGSLLLACCCSSCATIISADTQQVTIESSPPGVAIYENATFIGTTPFTGRLERRTPHLLHFKKNGYFPQDSLITTRICLKDAYHDLLYTAGLGLIVDACTDKWRELDIPHSGMTVYLEEDSTAQTAFLQPANTLPLSEEFEHLYKLRQDGAITEEEYQKAKAKLLQ